MAKILVTGGAGYIGSHMVDMLLAANHEVVVFDNLISGWSDAVLGGELIIADLLDKAALEDCFSKHQFDAVMHFAAVIQVGESVRKPEKYYANNLVGGINLIDAMIKHDVKKLVFSSTAAVYGEPQYLPIDINHPKNPINPYGKSKWLFEQILDDYALAHDLRSIRLRYFNAAGADPKGRLGPRHRVVTHVIPLVLEVASGRRPVFEVYGTDYATDDGTCVRDYIHVTDICSAHLLALDALAQSVSGVAYNLGNGKGYSVREVIKVAEQVTQKKIPVKEIPRRAGDSAYLIADAKLAKQELGWEPKYFDLKDIIQHAWQWELKMRNGG
jgi:UDP-glucose 4-epimerase